MAKDPTSMNTQVLPRPGRDWTQAQILKRLGGIRYGTLRVDFDGGGRELVNGVHPGPGGDIRIHRPFAFLRAVGLRGDLGFGESYMRGDWTSDDPAALLYLLSVNLEAMDEVPRRGAAVRLMARLQHALRRNSLRGSRRNIAAHYDLGNDFYARWLDRSMSYSSAIFDTSPDLFEAQQRKYELLFKLIDPKPGEHILEIGCGWGGFAVYAARHGVKVTGITLSREQHDYAKARVFSAGLDRQADIRLCDYRSVQGQYDHIVSIEMFEAVGQRYWQQYFDIVANALRPGGRAALQVITIREDLFDTYVKEAGGFIQKYIFPGGMLPTERHLYGHAQSAGLDPLSIERYGEHYADTLAEWAEAFSRQTDWLQAHGYDQRFRRMWEYYLAFCEAGFRDGRIDLVQVCVRKEGACKG